ncbi:hypothetical protein FHG87_023428, partial [Trinorchestia longiramus]
MLSKRCMFVNPCGRQWELVQPGQILQAQLYTSEPKRIEKRKKKYGPIYCKDTYTTLIKESQPKA